MNPKSLRPFIGAKDFETSRSFYRDMGFEEDETDKNIDYQNFSTGSSISSNNLFKCLNAVCNSSACL